MIPTIREQIRSLQSNGRFGQPERTHEIGIRMPLGANTSSILRMVLRQGLFMALVGITLGLAGALAFTRRAAKADPLVALRYE